MVHFLGLCSGPILVQILDFGQDPHFFALLAFIKHISGRKVCKVLICIILRLLYFATIPVLVQIIKLAAEIIF